MRNAPHWRAGPDHAEIDRASKHDTRNTSATKTSGPIFPKPFFNWDDDAKLREWLREQDPDALEQFLDWFDFSSRRDRQALGRQELRRLRTTAREKSMESVNWISAADAVALLKPAMTSRSAQMAVCAVGAPPGATARYLSERPGRTRQYSICIRATAIRSAGHDAGVVIDADPVQAPPAATMFSTTW